MMKQNIVVCFLVLFVGFGLFIAVVPQTQAQSSTPFMPPSIKVLIVSYNGAGDTILDLASYGFNTTLLSPTSGKTNYLTHTKTANINQYDVVILEEHGQNAEPYQLWVTPDRDEVQHFFNTFTGVLIRIGKVGIVNASDASFFGDASATIAKINARMGCTFTRFMTGNYMLNGTYYRTSSLIANLPDSIPHKTWSATYASEAVTLNGATMLYNYTNPNTTDEGITYYKNATGATGIWIRGTPFWATEIQTNVPYYWGMYGNDYQSQTAEQVQNRAELLACVIAYALDLDFDTLIKWQPMAILRSDDHIGYGATDAEEVDAIQYMYDWVYPLDVPISLATVLYQGGVNYALLRPNTVQKFKDLKLEDIGWSLETHFRHEDYRAYSVAQVETLIANNWQDYADAGFEKFSVGIAPAGYYADNVYTGMANKGLYLLDLTDTSPLGKYGLSVNGSVILKAAWSPSSTIQIYYANQSKDSIHKQAWWGQTPDYALALWEGAPTLLLHKFNFQVNEVGTWAFKTFYENLTAHIPDIKFTTNQIFAQCFGKKWAVISSPIQTGNTVTFTVNVNDVPTVATIGKGMLWIRITQSGYVIQSVAIDGTDWSFFDDDTIRIPTVNSNIEVTLASETTTTPHITESDRQISATSYAGNKLVFTVNSLSGTVSRTEIYCGGQGEPKEVVGATSWSYSLATKILTIVKVHSSPTTISILWVAKPTSTMYAIMMLTILPICVMVGVGLRFIKEKGKITVDEIIWMGVAFIVFVILFALGMNLLIEA